MKNPSDLTRREILAGMLASGAASFITGARAETPAAPAHAHDWDWLLGDWDVFHSRLKDRLVKSTEWQEFKGRSSFWTTLGGMGNVDDDIVELPAGIYRGLSLRAFDPKTNSWAIWWVDGRNPERIDPPVRGGFKGDEGEFTGPDVYKGTPVTVRFRWHEVRSKRPWWDQAYSTDGGKTWEINWRNYFTRTRATASGQPRIEGDPPEARQWDFLVGQWKVRNRRLRAGSKDWQEFDSTLRNWTVLGGRGNVGDNWFAIPGDPFGGMSLRVYNDEKKEWLSWWVSGREPANIGPPLRGKFENGIATLVGDDVADGNPIKLRSQWTRTDTGSPHWTQATSSDGGKTWETNWVADFERVA